MKGQNELRGERLTGGLLLAIGVVTLGIALYCLAIRPPMLPEDLRFTGVAANAMSPRMPRR